VSTEEAPIKPKIIAKKVEKTESPREEAVVAPEKPKARLVEREHAGEGLLRSVMGGRSGEKRDDRSDDRRKPAISF
jgi:hypothetical protein